MLEVIASIVVLAVALSFFAHGASDTMRLAKSMRRRGDRIRVAEHH